MKESQQRNPLGNSLYPIFFPSADSAPSGSQTVLSILRAARSHLGMDIAFISEFFKDHRAFRFVDTKDEVISPLKEGDMLPLDDGYCQRVVDGRLPELIPDTTVLPEAMALPETTTLPIGAHLSVPIRFSNGRVFGTFCCFSRTADQSLTERDLQVIRTFAEVCAFQLERDLQLTCEQDQKSARIRTVLDEERLSVVYQPIYAHEDMHVVGFECLARFMSMPNRSPDLWFNEAAEVGLRPDLELLSLKIGLSALRSIPGSIYLSVNVSPETIMTEGFADTLSVFPSERIVVEVTEHAQVTDYEALIRALEHLRLKGVRLAIDDAGAGYASLRHILRLKPDLIKLDVSLVSDIDKDAAKRALAAALIAFGRETGAAIVAEGVENEPELHALSILGVKLTQGYLLGRPMQLSCAMQLAPPDSR